MSDKVYVAEMTEIVLPGDTNHHGTLFGGKLMQWVDLCAALAAQRCAGSVVTASVDALTFKKPVMMGDVVTLRAAVNRVWDSSMEVGVRITSQSYVEKNNKNPWDVPYSVLDSERDVCTAYLTFVAVDNHGKRRTIDLEDKDKPFGGGGAMWCNRWNGAEKRRRLRLEAKE